VKARRKKYNEGGHRDLIHGGKIGTTNKRKKERGKDEKAESVKK